jgi:RNA-directed DNA polymerase
MWNPQRYRIDGLSRGLHQATLDTAVTQIEAVTRQMPSMPAVLTLRHLAERTQVDYKVLREIVESPFNSYRSFLVAKRSGGSRRIHVPSPALMRVQRWIAQHVLNRNAAHQNSFAFEHNKSIFDCAARHVGATWLIKVDLSDFFGSISEISVYRLFRSFGYQPLVAFELARMCSICPHNSSRYQLRSWKVWRRYETISSYGSKFIGRLPQGAPTSPMLSNLIMRNLDVTITALAAQARVTYTRYSDDITFSTTGDFDRPRAAKLVAQLAAALRGKGLYLNRRKTVVVPPGARKIVLGLLVDGCQPRLTSEFKNRLRQHLYFLETRGPIEHAKARGFETITGMYRHIKGLIDYANMVESQYAKHMLQRFNALSWPAE